MLSVSSAFALDLYRQLATGARGNFFVSPQSLSTALAMVLAGARGETAVEIERVLRLPATKVLPDGDDPYELVSANGLWVAGHLELSAAYVSLLRREHGAMLEGLDFEHDLEGARRRINEAVAEATRQKIPELIGREALAPETLLVLTNAIYLKAAWSLPFETSLTNPRGRFHAPDGDAATVAMMAQTSHYHFLHEDGVRVLELPYHGREMAMLVFLPDAVDGLADVERELTAARFEQWRARLVPRRVAVSLPRFSMESSFLLVPVLKAMGIQLAFDETGRADFSGISPSQLLTISEVIHQARIEVTEAGTEAAAATALVMRAGSAFSQDVEVFRADHPFLFAIVRHGDLLFLGRFTAPE